MSSPNSLRNLKRTAGPGRPRGSENRATKLARAFASSIVGDAGVKAKLLAQARAGKLAPQVMALMFYYAYGKPKEQIQVEVPPPVKVINKFHGVTPDDGE